MRLIPRYLSALDEVVAVEEEEVCSAVDANRRRPHPRGVRRRRLPPL